MEHVFDENQSCGRISGISQYENVTKDTFLETIYPLRKPAVLKDIDLGSCCAKWTVDYLQKVGGTREVKIHVSPSPQMNFITKNFVYRSLPFDTLVRRASETIHNEYFLQQDECYYLRSLGDDPRKEIADINKQFPELAKDVHIPEFFDPDKFFSSVFRIASPGCQLWTHYDVMDNLLIQVSGEKRVVLFSPSDAQFLYLNGDKSEVLDIDNVDVTRYPDFAKATRYECTLRPGDVLFIPALWFHNVISKDFGVAVNVFWRHLDSGFYDNKDTYGNKDPSAACRAMQIVDRALKVLDELPEDYRDFYARRLVSKIQSKAYKSDPP